METIISLYKKYREQILYLLSGVTTTLVNILCYALATRVLRLEALLANVAAWAVAITVAYLFNKIIVFRSHAVDAESLLKEMLSFVSARLATLGMETGILWLGIHVFQINDLLVKVFSNVLVIIMNYVLAKVFIFRKKV